MNDWKKGLIHMLFLFLREIFENKLAWKRQSVGLAQGCFSNPQEVPAHACIPSFIQQTCIEHHLLGKCDGYNDE